MVISAFPHGCAKHVHTCVHAINTANQTTGIDVRVRQLYGILVVTMLVLQHRLAITQTLWVGDFLLYLGCCGEETMEGTENK